VESIKCRAYEQLSRPWVPTIHKMNSYVYVLLSNKFRLPVEIAENIQHYAPPPKALKISYMDLGFGLRKILQVKMEMGPLESTGVYMSVKSHVPQWVKDLRTDRQRQQDEEGLWDEEEEAEEVEEEGDWEL